MGGEQGEQSSGEVERRDSGEIGKNKSCGKSQETYTVVHEGNSEWKK